MGNAATVQSSEPYHSGDGLGASNLGGAVRLNNAIDKDNTTRLQRESSQTSESSRGEPSADVVFETFYNRQGRSVTVMRRGNIRFYLDLPTGSWREFPPQWINEGVFIQEDRSNLSIDLVQIPKLFDDQTTVLHNLHQQERVKDDREGSIVHDRRGKLLTYIFEHRRHIHCYYDTQQHAWIKLPICWELTVDLVKGFIDVIQRQCPDWNDREDILTCLRASNYNIEDCVATYNVVKDWLGLRTRSNSVVSITPLTVNNQLRSSEDLQNSQALRDQLSQLKTQWTSAIRERDAAVEGLQRMQTDMAALRSELDTVKAEAERSRLTIAAPVPVPIPFERDSGVNSPTQKDQVILARVRRNIELLRDENDKLRERFRREEREMAESVKRLSMALARLKTKISEMNSEMIDLRAGYEKESLERKLLYNQFQELRGNIRVFCRCRRAIKQDSHTGEDDDEGQPIGQPGSHLRFPSDSEVKVRGQGFERVFRFDHVFDSNSTQDEVYREVSPIITSCADGYNVCIVAYGQTGSGKTYTMEGNKDSEGVCPRAISELLSICRDRDSIKYTMKLSAVEIYNDSIQDLLTPEVNTLEIRTTKESKIIIPGLTELTVEKQDDIVRIMKMAAQNRKVASTKMNSQSSRSHLVLALKITGENKLTGVTTNGLLQLCDLAGSERASKTDAQGQRLVEAAAINKSLSALGQVFIALKNSQMHIPFRNSKLTHLLQPCLSGDAKMLMIATISPDTTQTQETINTLQFAASCCQIALGPASQNVA